MRPAPQPKAKPPDKHDATKVMSPPPPAASATPEPPKAAAPVAATIPPQTATAPPQTAPVPPQTATVEPMPPAPVPRWSGRRKKPDSIGEAFDSISQQDMQAVAPVAGVSTKEDLDAVRGVFNEVAAVHVAQVRDVMLELRYGDAAPEWIASTKPALQSLRTMAGQMDLADLCEALDAFCASVDTTIARRGPADDTRTELLRCYQRLVELIPQAFELDGERDHREPLIIESLLFQIDGVERPIVDKLFAVGLNRLEALIKASVEELAVVTGIRREVATAIVAQLQAYRAAARSVLAAPDPASERRQLHDMLITMSLLNDDFNRMSKDWSDAGRAAKRKLRKQREQAYQRIKLTLARLGEREQLAQLERMPFQERIAAIDRYLTAASAARPPA